MSHSLQRSFLRAGRSSGVRAALLYTAIVAVLFVLYARQAASFGTDAPLMPVDDAYIHFQYARQAAAGQPFAYNAGQGATSGATSLFYPFVLAVGHALGFDGLRLGWWAYLIGASALLLSAFAARAAARAAGLSRWQHDLLGAAVAAWGALAWHTFSGMETALVVAFALLTFHAFERGRLLPFVVSASLLAMLRPEASIMSVVAVGLFLLRELLPRFRRHRIRRLTRPASLAVLAVPVLAAGLQPLLNLALTNSASASGGQAKSLLSIVPFDAVYVVGRIADNFIRAWEGFVVGVDRSGLWLLPPLSGMVALFGLFLLARRRPFVALLAALWLVLIFGLISTLDTANWHFRRYHMPLLALVWPLVAYAAAGIAARLRVRALLVVSAFVVSALLNVVYLDAHRDNVESVAAQPLAMARWLAVNTPADSLVAVHDVGLMRYLGGRDTLDMVGLTSAGMAEAWRSGPGAVGEALVHAPRRPDYIAAYDDARGLSYLADSLYGELMAAFRHDFDPSTNVALGGPFQGIYRPGWDGADAAATPRVSAIHSYLDGFDLTDTLNVAHLPDERAHDYRWANVSRFDGFATEMYLLDTPGCDAACRVLDGGRQLNGFESFTLAAQPGRDHILVSRFHAPQGGTIRVVINDTLVVERTLPAIPGQFVEIPTLIPADTVAGDLIAVRVEPADAGALIFPYRHWLYAGSYAPAVPSSYAAAFQDGAITLDLDSSLDGAGPELSVTLRWAAVGAPSGDYIAFVHLYADLDAPPVAQYDLRPGQGALPPGAWLPGILTDRLSLDLSGLAPGTYTLTAGLYDPSTFVRLVPVMRPGWSADAGRVIKGAVVIPP